MPILKVLSVLPRPWVRWLIHGHGLVRNPYTLGVRVIVEDAAGNYLLVRHSYLEGWYLPGGGVDRGETLHQAAMREVREEAGIEAGSPPVLLSMYLNDRGTLGRDHIGLFHLRDWSEGASYLVPNREILESRFFPPGNLPETVSPATHQRLAEFIEGRIPPGGRWSPDGAEVE